MENKTITKRTTIETLKQAAKERGLEVLEKATREEIFNGITEFDKNNNEDKETKEIKTKALKGDLFNTLGKSVEDKDYFFGGVVPSSFKKSCGKPVEREDLVEVFNKVFKPEDNILFYKQPDKEVYLIIVPIEYSKSIGEFNDSVEGDFQKHAISFLNEGSVNLETLKSKLERINSIKFINYTDR